MRGRATPSACSASPSPCGASTASTPARKRRRRRGAGRPTDEAVPRRRAPETHPDLAGRRAAVADARSPTRAVPRVGRGGGGPADRRRTSRDRSQLTVVRAWVLYRGGPTQGRRGDAGTRSHGFEVAVTNDRGHCQQTRCRHRSDRAAGRLTRPGRAQTMSSTATRPRSTPSGRSVPVRSPPGPDRRVATPLGYCRGDSLRSSSHSTRSAPLRCQDRPQSQ